MVYSKVAERTYMIDTIGAGAPGTVAVYVVKGARKTALIDCGFASTYGNVMQGLRQIGIEPSRVDYVIPTHAHLDHAGATGQLLMHMPKATVVAHERTVPHLVDPAKLIESSTSLFGEKLVIINFYNSISRNKSGLFGSRFFNDTCNYNTLRSR